MTMIETWSMGARQGRFCTIAWMSFTPSLKESYKRRHRTKI